MDKENKRQNIDAGCDADYGEDEDVFEDALEESTEEQRTGNAGKSAENKQALENKDANGVLGEITDRQNVNGIETRAENIARPDDSPKAVGKPSEQVSGNPSRADVIQDKIGKFKVFTIEEDGIERCLQSACELNAEFFKDEFDFVTAFCEINYDKNIFYSLIFGTMTFIKTWMSFEQPEIQRCLEVLNQCADYVHSRRKAYGWSDLVKKTNFDSFTDEQAMAEMTYGELQILIGCTTFIKDQNFSSLFKGAFKFKAGYQSFKYCKDIFVNRSKWTSNVARDEFYSGLLAGSGTFHLSIALAPPKVLSILEFIGFTCDENYALDQLRRSINLDKTIKSHYALIMMLVYFSYTQVTVSYGDYSLDELSQLVQTFRKRNPSSIFTNYFIAKELELSGELDKSILKFKEIVDTSKDLKQINNACHFELIFLNAAKQQWQQVAHYANLIRSSSLWSPCVFNFIYGIALYQIKEQTGNLKLQEEIDECFREVPGLRRRLAGKSTPIEKLAMSKCQYYFKHDRKIVLPMHELMFYYNLTTVFMRNKTVMSDNLQVIEDKLKQYDVSTISKSGQSNDYCLLLTLKGSYLRHMGYPSLAIETLEQILLFSKEIEENQLLPFATMEMAHAYVQLGQYEYAKRLLKSCINHRKYTAELILHFRAYNTLRKIKNLVKLQPLSNAKVQSNQLVNDQEIAVSE